MRLGAYPRSAGPTCLTVAYVCATLRSTVARKLTAATKAEVTHDGTTYLIGFFKHARVARDVEREVSSILTRRDEALAGIPAHYTRRIADTAAPYMAELESLLDRYRNTLRLSA